MKYSVLALVAVFCCGAALMMAVPFAADQVKSEWVYPVIKDYGRAWPLPHAAVQPEKDRQYKILFNLSEPGKSPSEPLPGLFHAARTLNVFSSLGVQPKDLQVVMVFHGAAAAAGMDNQVYRAKYNVDNPNLKLISQLKQAGVEPYMCGQSLHELNFNEKDMLPELKLATSAMVVLVTYQNDGYALMPF